MYSGLFFYFLLYGFFKDMHPYLFKNYRDGLIFTVEGVQCLILMTLSEITYSSNSWEGKEGGGGS